MMAPARWRVLRQVKPNTAVQPGEGWNDTGSSGETVVGRAAQHRGVSRAPPRPSGRSAWQVA